jgi:nucleoside-diphosphate-sugar epimerase
MHPVSIIGCGYTGSRLATRWLKQNQPVRGFGSRSESLAPIAATGAEAAQLNLDLPLATSLDLTDHLVYYTVAPPPMGTDDGRLERFLGAVVGVPQRVVYLSTTGVYGDQSGATVTEDTVPQPRSDRAIRRLAAETRLRTWADSREVSWCILRVPGIYGPGRLPLERLRRGEPAIAAGESTPGNRIHVEDLVTACIAAASKRAHRRIFNVTDGSDDSATAFLQRVARIAHLPPPPLISRAEAQRTFSAMSWSFLSESRRVDNRRLIDELGVVLAYQDLDKGIRASL